jgi:NhaP-type Na+/H+ or K+/H+ antiporter
VSETDIFIGFGLTILFAVGCQIVAQRVRIPAIVLLLPVGFLAGHFIHAMNPAKSLGAAFSPLVALAVAIVLFDGGLDLEFRELEGHHQRVVRRLLYLGIPITWAGATLLAGSLLGLSDGAAVMLGAIVIVSGPTVVAPLLVSARPGRRVSLILGWEGTMIDPFGAIIGALVFQAVVHHTRTGHGREILAFLRSIGVGALGGVIGAAVLWLLLSKVRLSGVLATEAILAVVVGTAAICDAARADSGLIAAIVMGVALANLPGIDLPEDRKFFRTIVQLVIGVLFISISATVTASSVRSVLGPTLVLVVGLVFVVRPLVAAVSTLRTPLTWRERAFIGWMDPRGIVAASTAASFGAPLAAAGVSGANKLVPATFLVIVGTVTLYGLTAAPVARLLGLHESSDEVPGEDEPPDLPADFGTVLSSEEDRHDHHHEDHGSHEDQP